MKITKHYNHRAKRIEKTAELTRGEQYQLMRDNIKLMQRDHENALKIKSGTMDHQGIDWKQVFDETVAFADHKLVYVDSYPTESANLTFD